MMAIRIETPRPPPQRTPARLAFALLSTLSWDRGSDDPLSYDISYIIDQNRTCGYNQAKPRGPSAARPAMRCGHRRRRAIAGKMTNRSPKESYMAGRNFLFVPGPTNVPDRVTRAMMVAMEDHRSPIFPELSRACLNGLKPVFKTTTGAIIIFPSSGTGCWEAALTNCLNPGDKVLASRFGQFSYLWADMCQRLGYEVEILETPWGEGAPIERYVASLSADKQHKIRADRK